MRRFDLTRLAQSDLKSIAQYAQRKWGVQQRNAYLKAIDNIFHTLARTPLIGSTCDAIRAGYRKFPHGAHVIYYTLPSNSELLIIRVLHAAIDVDSNIDA